MPYAMHRKLKPSKLTDEEVEVQTALKEYNFEPEDCDFEDFVPTTELYFRYLKYARESGERWLQVLTPGQFGLALQRVFGIELDRKYRRRVDGRAVNGYAYVRGPGGVRTHVNPGRPKVKRAGPESPAAPA